jgi:hypothetical protein
MEYKDILHQSQLFWKFQKNPRWPPLAKYIISQLSYYKNVRSNQIFFCVPELPVFLLGLELNG